VSKIPNLGGILQQLWSQQWVEMDQISRLWPLWVTTWHWFGWCTKLEGVQYFFSLSFDPIKNSFRGIICTVNSRAIRRTIYMVTAVQNTDVLWWMAISWVLMAPYNAFYRCRQYKLIKSRKNAHLNSNVLRQQSKHRNCSHFDLGFTVQWDETQ